MKMTRRLLALLLAFCLTFGNVMPAMATELAAEEPVVTEEPVVVPEVEETEAPAEEPEVTEAPVVEPEVTEAPVVEPEVTEAPVVEPEVTEAPVVEPEVTEAPVVEPEVTEAPVVEPEVTEAPVVEEPEEVEAEGADVAETASLSFASQTYRTEFDANVKAVYEAENIKFTNNKGGYSSTLRDNSGDTHIRMYKDTTATIEYPVAMTKLQFVASSSDYAAVLETSINNASLGNVVVDGKNVTVVLTSASASVTFTLTAQARVDSLTVYTNDTTAPEEPENTDPVADSTLSIAEAVALGASKDSGVYTVGKYYVTGVISEVYNTSYGNMYITDGNGNTLTIYGTLNADGSLNYSEMEVKPVAGDTVTIYGAIGNFNGTPQIKNGWITAHTPAGSDPDPDPTPDPTPGETTTATLSFATTDARVSQSATQQVWAANGITFTNDKAGSSSNVADHINPVRLYKSSKITIEFPGMTEVVFNCNTAAYATALEAALGTGLGTVVVSDKVVTLTLAEPANSVVITLSGGQVRMDSLQVSGTGEEIEEPEFVKPTTPEDIIAAAAALANDAVLDGGEYELTGEIIGINTAYDSKYGNITVTIAVEGQPVKCYRLSGDGIADLKVGDTITVTGSLTKKYDNIRFDAGCALGTVVAGEAITAPETPEEIAAAVYGLTTNASLPYDVTLTGVITDITDAYSSQYGNITLLMAVEGYEDKAPLKCYRLKGTGADNLAVGDTITVTGSVQNYEGQEIEFNQGCVLTAVELAAGRTEENPFLLYRNMFSANGTYDVTIPEGASVMYYALYNAGGMQLAIGDAEPIALTGNMMNPDTFSVTANSTLTLSFPAGHMENPTELVLGENVANIAAGSQGYYYTWTAVDNGTLALEIGAEAGWTYVVNNITTSKYGDTQWSDSDPVVNSAEIEVAKGDEIQIMVNTYDPADPWNAPAGSITVTASFTYPAGHEQNPIDLTADLLSEDDFSATVTVPAGETYHFIAYRLGGMLMTINGGEAIACPGEGPMAPPYTWTLNGGNEGTEYVITVAYPVGSKNNPAELEDQNDVSIAAGSQGYFFTYTAEESGILTVELITDSGWTYAIDNITAGKYGDTQWSDSDPVVNPAEIDVAAGDEIQIMVNTYDPDNMWNAPEGNITVLATLEPFPAGHEKNPIDLTADLLYEEDFSATVTVPAGKTMHYIAYRVGGMQMFINDGEPAECTTDGMMMPYAWSITNDGEVDADYFIRVEYPVGHPSNPMELAVDTEEGMKWNSYCGIEPNSMNGFAYRWTADTAGELTITVNNGVAGWSYFVTVTDYSDPENPISKQTDIRYSCDIPVLNSETVVVKAGDVVDLVVNTCGATPDIIPGGQVVVTTSFVNHVIGFDELAMWNEEDGSGTLTVTVPANTTYYILTYREGMQLSINGAEPILLEDPEWDGILVPLANETDAKAEYELVMTYPDAAVGTWDNPAQMVIGENVAQIAEGSQGYIYKYVAKANGTLTFTFSAQSGWFYQIDNLTAWQYGDGQWSDSDPVANIATIEVAKGDEIQITVNTYDPNDPWNAPAGEVTVTLAAEYVYAPGEDVSVPATIEFNWDEDHTYGWANIIIPANSSFFAAIVTNPNAMIAPTMQLDVDGVKHGMYAGNAFNPAIVEIVNENDWDSNYHLDLYFPAGTFENPEWIQSGKNTANVEADGFYVFNYEMWNPGYVTFTMNTASNWSYVINRVVTTWEYDETTGEDVEKTVTITGDTQYASQGGLKTQTFYSDGNEKIEVIVSTENREAGKIDFSFAVATKVFQIAAGKSKTLSFTDPATGKSVSGSKVKWQLVEAYSLATNSVVKASKYASIKDGKLTAKDVKLTAPVVILIRATYKGQENMFQVMICPKATSMQINAYTPDGAFENANGQTLTWTLNGPNGGGAWLQADAQGEYALDDVTWKSSNTKILKVNAYGELMPVVSKGKVQSGTVTITATAKDGSGKKASVKVKTVYLAQELEIAPKNGLWTIGSGVSVPMIAKVDPSATNKAVEWSVIAGTWNGGMDEFGWNDYYELIPCEETVATIDENGVLTIAEGLTQSYGVIVKAVTKDAGLANASCVLEVFPGAAAINVENVPTTYDLNEGNSLYPDAYAVTATGDPAECGLKWTSSNKKIAKIGEWGNIEFTGKTGTVKLTATTTDGTNVKKTVTVKVVKSPTSVTLSKHEATLAAGKSLTLKVTVGPKSATSKSYTWDIKYYQFNYETGEETELSAETVKAMGIKFYKGKFTVDSKKFNKYYNALESETQIYASVTATAKMAQPGYWEWNEELQEDVYVPVHAEDYGYVIFAPATKKIAIVQHNKVEDGQVVTGKTLKVDTEGVVVLTAEPTPTTAGYMYTWKSSNTKIAKVAQNPDGSVSVIPTGKKTGTVTITAKAADGSGKYAKVKVKVIQKVDEIKLDNSKFILSGAATKYGRSFDLNKLATIAPAKATYKTLKWYIADWDAELAAANKITVSSSGKLTAKMDVTEPVSISVVAQATDGYPAIAVTKVTITPAATKVIIVDTEGAEVTTTQSVKVKSTLTFGAKSEGEDAADLFTWKTSDKKIAKITVNADGTVTVTGVKKGTVTITATAKDGSGVKDTIKVKVVK